jgi:hypothetical protein
MKHILQLLIISLLFSCVEQEKSKEYFSTELIAHAGGAIDSCIYTNSLEALEQAFEKGYRFIELDLLLTCDSILVAAHSWGEFNQMTDSAHLGDTAPTFSDFASRKILGCYTPLSAHDINSFFEQHDNLFLVTDKISSLDILSENFPEIKERMVVEAFSYHDYCRLKDHGYFRVLYSCMAQDLTATVLRNLSSVEWMALHKSVFDNPLFRLMNKLWDFNIALFTVDDKESFNAIQDERVKMVYTNFILPP